MKTDVGVWGMRLGQRWLAAGIALALTFTLAQSATAQANWPQFRGAESRGVGTSDRLPLVWGPETNVAWRAEVPGRGWSSPIVWGKRVFLTTAVSEGELEAPKKGLYFGGDRPEPPKNYKATVEGNDEGNK